MKTFISLLFCVYAMSVTGGSVIVNSSDLAKGVKLFLRAVDGDKSFERDLEARESMNAAGNYLLGFRSCAVLTARVIDAPPFILPDRMTVEQVARVVDKYITDHPEKLHEPPELLVWNALNDAFHNKYFKSGDQSPKP
jgi:hypothetical protein